MCVYMRCSIGISCVNLYLKDIYIYSVFCCVWIERVSFESKMVWLNCRIGSIEGGKLVTLAVAAVTGLVVVTAVMVVVRVNNKSCHDDDAEYTK